MPPHDVVAPLLARNGQDLVVQLGALVGQPQVVHAHVQQLLGAVAIQCLHGLVDGQEAQAFVLRIHPHGLRVGIEQQLVLLLGRLESGSHLAQLHHGAQRFRQDLQVGQVARAEIPGLAGGDLEGPHHGAIHPQRYGQGRAHPLALVGLAHGPALGLRVIAQHGAAFLQVGPQQAVLQRQRRTQRPHHQAHGGLRDQAVAVKHLHHGPAGAGGLQGCLGHPFQHGGQRYRQRRDLLLHAHQLGMGPGFAQRCQFGLFALADVGHAPHHAQRLARAVADDKTPVVNPDVLAVVALHAVFGLPGVLLPPRGGQHGLDDPLAVVRVQAFGKGFGGRDVGLRGHVQQLAEGAAPPQGVGLHIPVPHGVGGGPRDLLEALLAAAQRGGLLLQTRLDALALAGQPGQLLPLVAQLDLVQRLACQCLQRLQLVRPGCARLRVHDGQRAQGQAFGSDQRGTGVKADVRWPQHQRIAGKQRILRGVGHHERAALPVEPVGAKRHRTLCLAQGQAHRGLEPLALCVHQVDHRHGHAKELRCQLGQLVKRFFGGCIENGELVQGLQPRQFRQGRHGSHGQKPARAGRHKTLNRNRKSRWRYISPGCGRDISVPTGKTFGYRRILHPHPGCGPVGQPEGLAVRRWRTAAARASSTGTVCAMLMQASVTDTPCASGWPGTMSWRPSSRWLSIMMPVMRASPAAICAATSCATVIWRWCCLLLLAWLTSIITCSRRPAAFSTAQVASTSAAL